MRTTSRFLPVPRPLMRTSFRTLALRRVVTTGLLAAVAAVAPLATPPVSAAVTVGASAVTGLADAQVVSITLAGIPAGQGVYVSQCVKPAIGTRAAGGLVCNGGLQDQGSMIWASTDGARGSQPAAGPLSLTLRRTFVKDGVPYVCGPGDCAIFVYRDHRGLFDTSLDTIVPISFLPSQTVALRAIGLPAGGSRLTVGSVTRLAAEPRTAQGRPIEVRAIRSGAEAPACVVEDVGGAVQVRAVRAGQCAISLYAEGTARFAALDRLLTYRVGR